MLLLSCINASEFGARRFPSALKPNAASTVCCTAPEIQSRKTQKSASRSIIGDAAAARPRMGNLSATIVLAATDKLLFYKCQWAF